MKSLIKSITKSEWFFLAGLSLGVIILTIAPLIYGWLNAKSHEQFTGVHFTVLTDWFVYYSYLEQVRQGHYLFKDLFTPEAHQPTLNIFWLGVGLLAKYLSLSNILALNLARILLIPVFYFVAYLFIALIFLEKKMRQLAVLILTFSSGFGALLLDRFIRFPANLSNGNLNWPMDLWVPELNTYFTLYYSPHFIASLILIIIIFLFTVLYATNQKLIYAVYSGLAALLLFSFHPFHVVTIFAVILFYFACRVFQARKIIIKDITYYTILLLISFPAVFYYGYFIQNDEVLRIKYAQNICFTTPLWLTIASLGLPFWAAIYVLFLRLKKQLNYSGSVAALNFIFIWVAVQFGLMFSPVLFQRRLSEGIHFPLAMLTALAWPELSRWFKQQKTATQKLFCTQRHLLAMFLVFLLTVSNLFVISADLYMYYTRKEFIYFDRDYVAAMEYLKKFKDDKVVLATAKRVVAVLPAYSGKTVYAGHGVETISFFAKEEEIAWFFQQNHDENIELNFLRKRNIGYIFYSKAEKELGSYNPVQKKYLQLDFENSQAQVYIVK
ncbi:MAG: hypothetical protein WCX71_01825 [Candidatus Buchananbacteria bacterium]